MIVPLPHVRRGLAYSITSHTRPLDHGSCRQPLELCAQRVLHRFDRDTRAARGSAVHVELKIVDAVVGCGLHLGRAGIVCSTA